MIYTYHYDADNGGIAEDTLTNESTANAPGFWLHKTIYPGNTDAGTYGYWMDGESHNTAADNGEDSPIEIDLTKAAEALGVTVKDLQNDVTGYFKVMTPSGIFTNVNITPSSGYTFNQDGSYNEGGDGMFGIACNEGYWVAYIGRTPESETWSTTTTFCFEVDGKKYVFNVTLMDQESFTTGIKDIQVNGSSKAGKMCNLQGMEISNPVKGQIYIQNGKKMIK